MTDYSNLKRLADSAPMAMTMTNGGEEHKALIAFTDEVKRLFGNDVGMARVLIAENEALLEMLSMQVYERWSGEAGYVPWVRRGNSLRQDEARRIARALMSKEG